MNTAVNKTCSKCKVLKTGDQFYTRVNTRGKRVIGSACKECEARRASLYSKNNKSKRCELVKKYQRKCREMALSHYSGGDVKCACCGIRDVKFLAIDHIDGGGNKHRETNKISYLPVWLKTRKFPSGFQVLCHNCNFAKSYGGCTHVIGRHYGMADPNGYADIHDSVSVGLGSKIWNFSAIEKNVTIGVNTVIGSNTFIGEGTVVGNGVHIQTGVFIPRNTVIGSHVFIGPNVSMTDDKYPKAGNHAYRPEPPVLKDGCSIGAGAVLLPGVVIGEGATVGAGAVVSRDVRPHTTVVGVPAQELALHKPEETHETA